MRHVNSATGIGAATVSEYTLHPLSFSMRRAVRAGPVRMCWNGTQRMAAISPRARQSATYRYILGNLLFTRSLSLPIAAPTPLPVFRRPGATRRSYCTTETRTLLFQLRECFIAAPAIVPDLRDGGRRFVPGFLSKFFMGTGIRRARGVGGGAPLMSALVGVRGRARRMG